MEHKAVKRTPNRNDGFSMACAPYVIELCTPSCSLQERGGATRAAVTALFRTGVAPTAALM